MVVNLELLAELVAFQRYGTLSATAEHLMMTQPTVTRGMKRLEQSLGGTLFDRQVSNRIKLNATGLLAAKEAEKLLKAQSDFTDKILNYDRLRNEIAVASVAPGPTGFLEQIKNQIDAKLTITHQTINPDKVLDELRNLKEKLIFTNQEIVADDIESMYLGIEYLGVGIDKFNPLSQRKRISFRDLEGLSFLVVQDIGPWRQVVEDSIPNATFLYQENLSAMSKISQYSSFPFFFSNLSQQMPATVNRFNNSNRNTVQITDPRNQMELYGTYLKSERQNVQPILKEIVKRWPK